MVCYEPKTSELKTRHYAYDPNHSPQLVWVGKSAPEFRYRMRNVLKNWFGAKPTYSSEPPCAMQKIDNRAMNHRQKIGAWLCYSLWFLINKE